MKRYFAIFLLPIITLAIASCEKEPAANCQSSTYWADVNLNGRGYNTLAPCAEFNMNVDSAFQVVDTQVVNGYRFTQLGNKLTLAKGDSSIGTLRFHLFFFAKTDMFDSLDNNGLTIAPANICAILDSNFHRLGNSLQDTTLVITNILFVDADGYQRESYYVNANWQVSGYGFQPLQIEGTVDGACRTRFEMNALLSDSTRQDTIALYGTVRMPFQ